MNKDTWFLVIFVAFVLLFAVIWVFYNFATAVGVAFLILLAFYLGNKKG